MKYIIKTSKGTFIIEKVGYNEVQDIVHVFDGEDVFIIQNEYGITRFSFNIYNKKFYKLSEITEEQASEIVDNHLHIKGIYYDYLFIERYIGTSSAVHSLYSLIKSQGIEITENTYIFKV